MTSIQPDPLNKDNSNTKNILVSSTNNQSKKNDSSNPSQVPPVNANLNKLTQIPTKDKRINKLNINSCVNVPSGNSATNRDHSDYFDNEVLYQDEEEIDPIFKEYTMIADRRNKAIDDLANNTQRVKVNHLKIEELKRQIKELKEEKKNKHTEIINLLSNKETIEEIYENNISSLNTNTNGNVNSKNNYSNTNRKNDNKSGRNYNRNSNNNDDKDAVNPDEATFKVTLDEIKESEQKKYVGQVISMFEDIFKKRDEKINALIAKNIKYAYELFVNNINQENYNEKNNDVIIANFFGKVSLFISNHSLGRFTENKINLFLRYLLKINAINVKLSKNIKFVTKKYEEKKKELNDMISFLEKKNINLTDKNKRLENTMKEYDDKLEFLGKNDVFEFIDNSDEGIIKEEKMFKNKRKIIKRNKLKNKDNEEHLSHDVVIEYEDGIDQNAEINYEDDLANEYDYEKENEMIKQGLNPYNNDANKMNLKKDSSINNKNIKQIIVNDENDKSPNDFLQNANATNLSVMVIRNRSKRLNTTNEQQNVTQPNNDERKDSAKKLEHYKRVQRIMNSGPKVVGIFGVNNYNPENSMYANKAPFSPNKTENNVPNSSNKINKTIRIGSKDNHNFVSVINKTRMVPVKKKNTENKTKDKSKKNNNNDDTVINVINLEENFLNELKDDDKNENAGESTNYNSKSNKNNNSNEIIENDDNYKSNKPNEENNKNEVQGYFLNIINSKQNKENENENEKNSENNKIEKLNSDSSLNENNEFFKNSGKNVVKVAKNNKVGMITKKHPKGLIPNDGRRTKLTINTDNSEVLSSINTTRYKVHNSLSKNINHKKISNNSVTENNYSTINDSSLKRSHSISVNAKNEESNSNNNNKYTSKVIVSSNISQNNTSRKRSIPKSKINN